MSTRDELERFLLVLAFLLLGCGGPTGPSEVAVTHAGERRAGGDCPGLVGLSLDDASVTSATLVAADPSAGLPEYCDVLGKSHGTITFNVRLPTAAWNGKAYFGGNMGFAGHIRRDTSTGLSRGYATISTDTGHTVQVPELDILDASWALNNVPAEVDFGYRAVHESTVVGKNVVRAFYGRPPSRSYFDGCSNGGRQALQEAARYPGDYDGIIAGAPVLDETGLMTGYAWDMQALHATETSSDITADTLITVAKAVLARCDGLDGVVDGLLDDPRRCDFDPASLSCSGAEESDCLTPTQVTALRKIYAGPSTSSGERLYPGFLPGGEAPDPISANGWDAWFVSGLDSGPSIQFILVDQFLRYLAFRPDRPEFTVQDFDFDRTPQQMKAIGQLLDPGSDLSNYRRRGGKLLMYQGWSDASVAPTRTVAYLGEVKRRLGQASHDFVRLFMVPGMFHCSDGPGPNVFDSLGALETWVEDGRAPDSILATHFSNDTGEPDRTRPLCPYPQVARYLGAGSIDDAASFRCVRPGEAQED
jgi:feruloyl esterase